MFQTYLRLSILLLFSLILFSNSCKKEEEPIIINTPEELDTFLSRQYAKSQLAGFSLCVIKKGQISFQESYGLANIDKETSLTNQTAMNIASVSKLFVGVALMKAIEQGYFDLKTPINNILPFSVTNPSFSEKPLLVKHLVTHTSGIMDDEATYFSNYSILDGEDTNTPMAQKMIDQMQVKTNGEALSLANFLRNYLSPDGALYDASNFADSPAGTAYAYSNIASALAAYLIEVKTGIPFEEYTKEYIFTPLQMKNTAWKLSELDRSLVSRQYWTPEHPLPFYTFATYPDGSLLTSISDLSLFMLEMMRAQVGESDLLLSKESYKALFEKKFDLRPTGLPKKEDNYGVFWVWSASGRLGHTGSDFGSTCLFGFDPEKQTGSILLINTNIDEREDESALVVVSEIAQAYKSFENAD